MMNTKSFTKSDVPERPKALATSTARCLGYLSGAPRVSTQAEAEASGARAHVVGVMNAFKHLDWELRTYVVGDRVPKSWRTKGSQQAISKSAIRRLAADGTRLVMRVHHSRRAYAELKGHVAWVYERFGAFQALGRPFQRAGIPWILETNGPLFLEAKNDRKSMVLSSLAKRLELQAYRQCDVLLCVSHRLKEILVDQAGIRPEKVLVIPNGVDVEQFNPERHAPIRFFDTFTIGMVGNLYPWSGTELLIDAIDELRQEGLTISLVIVGDGLARHILERKVAELQLASQVKFAGRVAWAEVPSYLLGFDVGYSGQVKSDMMYRSPIKLYEYMAMGLPAVAAAFEDAERTICDHKNGFLFEPGNKEDLKRAIRAAYEARSLLTEMGKKARLEICLHHSWDVRVRQMIDEIEGVLER